MRVFLADDSEPVRERILAMLGEIPDVQVVGHAEDSIAARLLISALQPDVVILDINMPGGSGIEVLQDIKQMTPSPTVIMLTNYSQPQYRRRCMEAGADHFLDKSTEFEKIRALLGNRS
jgi:DNA-binding NarL/FixJ family response regulator